MDANSKIEAGKMEVIASSQNHLKREGWRILHFYTAYQSLRICGLFALGMVFSLFIRDLSAQSDSITCAELSRSDRVEWAGIWIEKIKDHGIIVVLESNRRKMEFLENALENPENLSSQQKRSHRKELDQLREKTAKKGEQMIAGFAENYTFSKVHFIWDHDIPHLIARPDTNLLLDPSMQYMKKSHFEHPNELYFLVRGRVDPATGSGIQAFLVRNVDFNPLCRPFPFYVARNENFIVNVLLSIFNPDLYGERSGSKVAEDLDNKFHRFRGD
nr:hypothetical protein [Saprospiraceae bacterium]